MAEPVPEMSSAAHPEHGPQDTSLPSLSPDHGEEQYADSIENIVPAYGRQQLPVVGLGGSAGAISAVGRFLEHAPANSGMAYVVVLHLAPHHHSTLPELLQRHSAMPVHAAHDAVKLEADRVYVIPPGKHLTTADGHLRLTELQPLHGKRVAVDLFFRSLADTHGAHATAIVLSGADGDGAIGLKRIKERGGLTIAQDPGEAEHPSMPKSAVATGMVDWVLRVADMPARIVGYRSSEARLKLPPEDGPEDLQAGAPATDQEAVLREVLDFIRARAGRDFSDYKRATILRRIARRMQVSGVEDMAGYLSLLRTQPGEAMALVAELLISVTNFFRDREAFRALEPHVAALFQAKRPEHAVRVWVTACATGEEAYSMAIMLLEQAREMDTPPMLQVFGSDLDEEAIRVARAGVYPETIAADVSEDRLRRYFSKVPNGYRVRRFVREMLLFATHDLLKDAPFSRIDLLSSRNLLIYLNRQAQARCLEIFNFALRPEGVLFLGTSETVPEGNSLFTTLDKKHRIYRHRQVQRLGYQFAGERADGSIQRVLQQQEHLRLSAPALPSDGFVAPPAAIAGRAAAARAELPPFDEVHFRLLAQWGQPSVIVDASYDIVHLSVNANRFLQLPGGEPTNNLLRLAHAALRVGLRSALLAAEERGQRVEVLGQRVVLGGETVLVDIQVAPGGDIAQGHFLVIFAARPEGATAETRAPNTATDVETTAIVQQLERQLAQANLRLRATVEQHEVSNEELKAGNEELQAMNEELRSAGEELESGREELQSVNEELTTLNAEFRSRVEELSRANSDLHNLMSATQIATVFLDRDLRIMRYTPPAAPLFNLIASDVGRLISDLKREFDYPDLIGDARQVLQDLAPVEREIRADERWFLARILPYRTEEDRIAGVGITFVDITDRRSFDAAQRASERRLRTLADAVPQVIWTNDGTGKANYFNRRWYEYSGCSERESVGPGWQAIVHPDDLSQSVDRWHHAMAEGEVFETEYRLRRADGQYRWFLGRNVPSFDAEGKIDGWFGSATDIDDLKTAAALLKASEEQFRRAIEEAPIPVIMQAEDGQVLQISKAWTALTGFGADDVPTVQAWLDRAYGPGAKKLRDYMRELFKGNVSLRNVDLDVIARDGSVRHWLFSASAPGELIDGRRFIVGMVSDITERRHAEAQLSESKEQLRLIVDNARDYAIFSLSLERRVTSWNTGAQTILGYDREEAIGASADIIFTEEDRAAGVPLAEVEKALADGRATDERWHVRKNGSRFWGSGVMMVMRDAEGTAVGMVKIFRDQTAELLAKEAMEQARRELHAALRETELARDQAEAAAQAKDRFLAVLSHELRTPLTPVLMGVQVLARNKSLPANAMNLLEVIERNARLQAHLVDDLLDVTRITHGKMELSLQSIDLHAAVLQAVEVAHPDMHAKNQQLQVRLDAEKHMVSGDAKRLQQVFWNLLKNASKFTPEGGAISVQSRTEGEHVAVEVRDTGIGFDPEAASRIFDVFEQESRRVTARYGGLGLGLSIAEASVKAHGGSITAASEGADKGAVFTVVLPLA